MENIKVSYCILTYNQEKYIEETIEAAFAQTYSPMEIIISDDGSTDNTFDIVKRKVAEYKGPNKIIINQNNPNLGLREHYNKVWYELSHGEYLIMADGDDVSINTRVEDYVRVFERFPEVVMVSSKSIETDSNLKPLKNDEEWDGSFSINTINDYIDNKNWLIHSSDSRGLKRTVIDTFPPIKYPKAEDLSCFLRALLVGSECYLNKGYVYRRHHEFNCSNVPLSSDGAQRLVRQMDEDVQLALDKKLITDKKALSVMEKFKFSLKYLSIYGVPFYSSPKVFMYRLLSRLFKVTRSRL